MKNAYDFPYPRFRLKRLQNRGGHSATRDPTAAQVRQLVEIIRTQAPDNPFPDSVRVRNELMLRMIIDLGLRSSELLELRTSDIDPNGMIRIPMSKGRAAGGALRAIGRVAFPSPELTDLIAQYVSGVRSAVKGSAGSDFLFVSEVTGIRLSGSALTKTFNSIQRSFPGSFAGLTAYALRRAYCRDFFSKMAEKEGDVSLLRQQACETLGWNTATCERYYAQAMTERAATELTRVSRQSTKRRPLK